MTLGVPLRSPHQPGPVPIDFGPVFLVNLSVGDSHPALLRLHFEVITSLVTNADIKVLDF